MKWSKAKPADDGSPRIDLAVPAFGYKNHVGIDRRHVAAPVDRRHQGWRDDLVDLVGLDCGAAAERLGQAPYKGQEEAVREHGGCDVFVTGWRIDALLANEAVGKAPQKAEQLDDVLAGRG